MTATSLTPRTVRSNWKPCAFGEPALPAALGLLRQRIEPLRDIGRRGRGLLRIAENVGVEHADDRRLLDDLAVVAAVQAAQHVADDARLLDQLAQVGAGALLAGRQPQHRVLEAGVDQVVLQRALVLEILLGLAARRLCRAAAARCRDGRGR